MEKDGITRIYFSAQVPEPAAWEVYPTKYDEESLVTGSSAQAIISRADFECRRFGILSKNPENSGRTRWAVYSKISSIGNFVVKSNLSNDLNCKSLADELETTAGKEGLTILITV